MTSNNDRSPTSEELSAKLEQTSLGDSFTTESKRRRLLFDCLSRSSDPLSQEIGQELARGRTSVLDLVNSTAYAEHLLSVDPAELDPASVAAKLDEHLGTQENMPCQQGEEEEEEDFSQTSFLV